jgi:hypothetical protein
VQIGSALLDRESEQFVKCANDWSAAREVAQIIEIVV